METCGPMDQPEKQSNFEPFLVTRRDASRLHTGAITVSPAASDSNPLPSASGSADAIGAPTETENHSVNESPEDDARFRVLHLLQLRPELSQRQIAEELGIALGRVNFLLNALIDKGMLEVRKFRSARNKTRYVYLLTPGGLAEKAALTGGFLRRKTAEYEALKAELDALRRDMPAHLRCGK